MGAPERAVAGAPGRADEAAPPFWSPACVGELVSMEPVGAPPRSRALSSASVVDRCAPAGGLDGRTGVAPVAGGVAGGSEARRDGVVGRCPGDGRPKADGSALPGSDWRLRGVEAVLPGAAAGRWDPGLVAEAGRTTRPGEEGWRGARARSPLDVDGRAVPAAPGWAAAP